MRPLTALAATLTATALLPAAATASSVEFSKQKNYTLSYDGLSGEPVGMAVGNADTDGNPDIVVVSSGGKYLFQFEGKGDGSFGVKPYGFPYEGGGTNPTAVQTANVHGRDNVVVATASSSAVVGGLHDWTSAFTVGLPGQPAAMATGDFDEDGRLDLAITANPDVMIVLQTGSGWTTNRPGSSDPNQVPPPTSAFGGVPLRARPGAPKTAAPRAAGTACTNPAPSSQTNTLAPAPSGVATGDIDQDGHLDLFVSSLGTNAAYSWIAYGDGNGCFPRADVGPLRTSFAALADLDGRNGPELIASEFDCTVLSDTPPNTCNTALNVFTAAGGTYRYGTAGDIGIYPNAVDYPQWWSPADFDGDGHLDVFTAGYRHVDIGTSGYGSINLNQQVGGNWNTWGNPTQIMSDSDEADGPMVTGTADFDRDGYPDAVTLNRASQTISVMLNETAANAVVVSADATVATTEAAGAATRSVGAAPNRAVALRVRCRRGAEARRCRGTLTLKAASRAGRRLARVDYDLAPGRHTVAVPVRARLRRALGGAPELRVVAATRTAQPDDRKPARHRRAVTVRG